MGPLGFVALDLAFRIGLLLTTLFFWLLLWAQV